MCPWELSCLGRGVGTECPVLRLFLEGGTELPGAELAYTPD